MRPASRLDSPTPQVLPVRPAAAVEARREGRRWRIALFWQIGAGYVAAVVCFFLVDYLVGLLPLGARVADALALFAMGLVAVGLSVFTSRVTDRVKTLNRHALQISRGDLSRPLTLAPSRVADEIDELARSIQMMQENLRELTGHIQHTAQSQTDSADHMQHATENVNGATEEVAASMAEIARGADMQKDLVERTSKLINLIAGSIERTARSAEDAARAAADSSSTAQAGGQAAMLAGDKIKRVFAQVERAGEMVFAFGERTKEISKIVEAITGVANQTHLLALNATIEAARAGEYGRGFAVVADEVRKLAESAGTSAQEIRRLAIEIQAGSSDIVDAMEEGTVELNEGRQDLDTIIKSLERVVKTAMRGAEKVELISASAREQLTGSEEMVRAIHNIHEVAQSNAGATEEVAAVIRKQTTATAQLTSAAQELINLSMELQTVASRFHLG